MKLFLDCGTNLGQGLNQFNKKYNFFNNEDWVIETFEPNPDIKNNFDKIKNVTAYKKAIWTENGTLEFARDVRINQYSAPNDIGGTGTPGELTNVGCRLNEGNIELRNARGEKFGSNFVQVESLNFSEYVSKLDEYDEVIVKMDIEGAEYDVLRHMLKEGTITKIDELYVETHERFVKGENVQTTQNLLNEIRAKGIKVHKWD